ncbi:GNAT family N-acetyltransferase [Aureimonas sp. SK2]|uniref:GNAT family N-acetyltransferase n=1 Tax=Aureimonas sp. SK2 TaxID=3015992 RepID=UPI002444901A|nr:GNAT family N-acetyltransferase [Aureimonas sp. SK2]
MATIRPIRPSDAEGLLAVWRETWPATYGPTLGAAAVAAMLHSLDEGVAAMLPPGTSDGFCAVDSGVVVATAIHSVGRPVVHLWGVYVRPDRQGQGLGKGLMDAVRRAAGTAPIECRVVERSEGVVKFYRALGFRIVGEEATTILRGVAEPCLVMRLGA